MPLTYNFPKLSNKYASSLVIIVIHICSVCNFVTYSPVQRCRNQCKIPISIWWFYISLWISSTKEYYRII